MRSPLVPVILAVCAVVAIFPGRALAQSAFRETTKKKNSKSKSSRVSYDSRMIQAADIAVSHAYPKPTWRCWHYVKDALLASGVINSRPTSAWAKQAGDELCTKYGFTKLKVKNPMDAPIGAVVVYGGPDAGHVELRTADGFVSDFVSPTPYPRPLIGVYVKAS